jgi:hypothetical protein
MMFDDHMSPERVRIDRRWQPEENEVCGPGIAGQFEPIKVAMQ